MTTEVAPPLGEEVAIGGTPAGRAANAALRCFSKAARAFTLYDPQNEAVRRFLQEYRDALAAFLAAHGPLDLEVRQFDLACKGEVVHSEKDREKSLAYRLFRDGIRRLVIQPGATWEEQLKMLEILSVRFIGVRQQEEDVVTLLTRAAFRSIQFVAATGLVAEKDEDGPAPKKAAARTFPPDFDGPVPPLFQPRIFGCFPIPKLALEQFEAEESAETVPGNAVRMVRELLDDANPEELKTLVPAVEEVRDFLMAELDVKHLRDLAKVVAGQHGNAAAVLGPSMKPLAAPVTLQKLLATVPPGEEPPDALVELLDNLARYGADLLEPLLDRIAETGVDPALRTLVTRAAQGKQERVLARLATSQPPLTGFLLELAGPGAQKGAAKALIDALQAPHQDTRLAAAETLARQKEKEAFEPIRELLVSLDTVGLDQREAEAMGTALANIDPKGAFELFTSWLRPPQKPGLLGKLAGKKPKRMLLWAATAGLIEIPGEPTLALLREIGAHAGDHDEELKKQSLKAIAFWRKRGAQPNG